MGALANGCGQSDAKPDSNLSQGVQAFKGATTQVNAVANM